MENMQEQETQKIKEKPVTGIVIETGKYTEYKIYLGLGTYTDGNMEDKTSKDNGEISIKHENKTLNIDRKNIFVRTGFIGGIKERYLFWDLTKTGTENGTYNPIGMEAFDPTEMVTAEEADLKIHEKITARTISNIVQKLKEKGGSKAMLFIMILIIVGVIIGAFLKIKGVF